MTFVKLVLSCKSFSGFSRTIHMHEHDSMPAICAYVKKQLVATLELENMRSLVEAAEKMQLHSEFKTASDLFDSGASISYLCDCDHGCGAARAPPPEGDEGLVHTMMALLDEMCDDTFLNPDDDRLSHICIMDMLADEHRSPTDVSQDMVRAYVLLKKWARYKDSPTGDPSPLSGYDAGSVSQLLLVPARHHATTEGQDRLRTALERFEHHASSAQRTEFVHKTLETCNREYRGAQRI